MNILVLCTGNSARSILLEAILNDLGAGRLRAWSAGSHPAGEVHPHSLALLGAKGLDTGRCRSKSWDEFASQDAPKMDAVITVCGSAAAETCPFWPGTPVRAHWGVEDPVSAGEAAFEEAYGILRRRAEVFLAKDVEKMDAGALKTHLAACGEIA